ncbi:MAG: hypothetical protein AB1730_01910 [Myxococcota bacterium]
MFRVTFVASFLLLLSGCALRPRYTDFVSPTTAGEKVTGLWSEMGRGRPLPGVNVEVGELKGRVRVTTAADGTFSLPVDKKLVDDNPVIVVAVPRGVSGYELTVVAAATPAPAPPSPKALEAPAPPAAPASPQTPAEPAAPTTPSNG